MKCKNCGGELLFQNGTWQCKSCGNSGKLDSIYENIDVYICYEESDSAGRRTKDSIVAQEIYRKLEESKVATFYERVFADGMTGNDLETGKFAAIHRAKIIIVLGTSVENFTVLEKKYGEYFAGKSVIPFCVDINPAAIPKTLSKIQAISYSTIGWDKDLIKGVCNILGRKQNVDISTIYGRRKCKRIIVCVIALIFAIVSIALGFFLLLDGGNKVLNTSTASTEENAKKTEESHESVTNPLTQKEIYDNANELLNQSNFIEALELFLQIPDYPNSANMINQIYSKYEGYYQKDGTTLHLEVADNSRADLEITMLKEGNIIKIVESAELLVNSITLAYVDNIQNSGNLQMFLENTGLRLCYGENENDFAEIFFELEAKSDKPIIQLDSTTMLNWLKNKYSFNQIVASGYELEAVEPMTSMEFPDDENTLYKIKDTEIYLSMIKFYYDGDDEYWFDEQVLVGIAAPAEWIAPALIGENSLPVYEDDIIYWPNGYLFHYSTGEFVPDYFSDEQHVSESTIVGVVYRTSILNNEWEKLVKSVYVEIVKGVAKISYADSSSDGYLYCSIRSENDTHYLVSVESSKLEMSQRVWYKIDKQSKNVTFIMEGPAPWRVSNIEQVYSDIIKEFPMAFY